MKKIILTVFLISILSKLFSQALYIPLNIRNAYHEGTRSTDGKPGKGYWQNSADYNLKIKFNPKNLLVTGSEDVEYSNNSHDTLKKIIIKLYPDFYKKGVIRDRVIAVEDESDGVIIDKLIFNTHSLSVAENTQEIYREGTNMHVHIKPLLPGQKLQLTIGWHYTLNKGSHNRTGEVAPGSYFLAYTFPRIAVYDDIEGWDESLYEGQNEPFFDYGNFNAEITVPKDYIVWATGELQNMEEVFQPGIVGKYKSALGRDQITHIIDSAEAKNKKVTLKNKWNTFKFEARQVSDFAFAVSDHYIWEGSGLVVDSATRKRILVNTVYNKTTADFYEVNYFSRKTLEVMAFDFPGVPYPYPHLTIFEGADQMEYPMMVNDNPVETRKGTIELTDHEIFHMFFPFYVGTNQTHYAWMDEGWATFAEWYISPIIDSTIFNEYGTEETKGSLGRENDVPLIIRSSEIEGSYFVNAYPKPAYIYLFLMDILGDSLFRTAIRQYIADWHGKHPIPWDFFNSINKTSGKNLNWFWKAWFYDFGAADIGISALNKTLNGSEIQIVSTGNKPLPVYCTVYFRDGTIETLHETAEIWANGKKEAILHVKKPGDISKITLFHPYVPDGNTIDNIWTVD